MTAPLPLRHRLSDINFLFNLPVRGLQDSAATASSTFLSRSVKFVPSISPSPFAPTPGWRTREMWCPRVWCFAPNRVGPSHFLSTDLVHPVRLCNSLPVSLLVIPCNARHNILGAVSGEMLAPLR